MTRRWGGAGVDKHSWIVFVPRWLAIVLVTAIAFLVSPTTSALGAPDGLHKQPPGYSAAGDSKGGPNDDTDRTGPPLHIKDKWGTGDMAPMYLLYLINHPEMQTAERNIAVIQLDPTDKDPHTYHFVTATVNNTDGNKDNVLLFDAWKDGVFQASAAFEVKEKDDLLRTADMPPILLPKSRTSGALNPLNKHSEQMLAWFVEISGSREQATSMLSALDACTRPSNNCSQKIKSFFPKLDVFHFYSENMEEEMEFKKKWLKGEMPDIPGPDMPGIKLLRETAAKQYGRPSQPQSGPPKAASPFEPPGGVAASGALVDAASQPPAPSLGGIDFSSLELRYLADTNSGDNHSVQYAFTAVPATGNQRPDVGLRAAQQASDAFFVWLTLPTSKFTVNLNPDEPNRIIDADLGRTDAGRTLLEADLRLKKTVAALIHPDTPLGAKFWEALEGVGENCFSFRQWIVPAPAVVRENAEELYILDAPLLVKMETEYFQARGLGNGATACPVQQKSVEAHNEEVFRTMVLPLVQRAVNEAPEYAELRRIYLSRVAAEWYRDRSTHENMAFAGLINHGDITPWTSRQPWSPREVFNRYVESFTNGEFNVTRQTQRGAFIETKTYILGGVDLTNIPFNNLTAGDFQTRWPGLSNTVKQAFDHPAVDQKGRTWLGSTSAVSSTRHDSGGHFTGYFLLAMIGVAAAVCARSWWRLRLARRDWARANPPAPSG
jgi:hypothetical protein